LKNDVLNAGGFDESLKNGVLTEFFIRMNKKRVGAMVCPHALFEMESKEKDDLIDDVNSLLPLAKKLKIDNIILPNRKRIWICDESWTYALHHNLWLGGGL